jgi:hypothetical protein
MTTAVVLLKTAIVVGTGLDEVTCRGSTVKGHARGRTSS